MAISNLNPGAQSRGTRVKNSKTCELKGQVLVDCLKVSKPILDGVDIGLNFFLHDAKACLLANWAEGQPAQDYVIEIEDARLEVGRIRPKKAVIQSVYPYVHRDLLHMIHEKSLSYFGPVTIASGVLPKRVIVGLLTETAFNGNFKNNRLQFTNHDVDNVVVRVNSVDKPYRGGYVMKFKENVYMDAYYGLFKELGQTTGDCEVGPVTYIHYDNGYTLYAFDTSPDHSASYVGYGKTGFGSCELMIHFKDVPLKDNLVVLVVMEFERKFILHKMEPGNIRQYRFENHISK